MSNSSRKSISRALWALGLTATGSLLVIPSSLSAPAPKPVEDMPDISAIIEMGASPEEKMIYGDLPATPESGNENPEDLLTSSPLAHPSAKNQKSASAKEVDPLPKKLRELPSGKKPLPRKELLPPPPAEIPVQAAAPAQTPVDSLTPEADTEIPTGLPTASEEPPLPEAPLAETPVEAPPLEEAPTEAPAESVADTSTSRWDRSVPLYDRDNPNWAFQISGSPKALGRTDLASNDGAGNISDYDTRSFGLGFEWEPKALQSAGVFSVGLTGNVYILEHANEVRDPAGPLTNSPLSIYSVGATFRYQFRYLRGQFLVPFVGFEAQQMHYRFADYSELGSGWTLSTGPTFGALLLLNWMEPSAAHNLWADSGIRRSYLFAEMKMLKANQAILSVDGSALYFGLRMEY